MRLAATAELIYRAALRGLTLVPLSAVGCAAASAVKYVDGQCMIDGVPTTLTQVEAHQAEMTQHILSRQPVLTAIAVTAVVVAGAGYLQRLLTVLAARRAPAQNLGDRLRARMERYRAHPVRYFLLLSAILGLLAIAGGTYVSMDADKRASERSLATLQFCHLALRSANEQRVLSEQREHLASIQSTERDIRALVDTLPPAEQQKAREIIDQLSASLGQQRTMVAQFAQHASVAAKAVADQQVEIERGLSKLDGEVVDLKSMPAAVSKLAGDLHDFGSRTDALGGEIEACDAKLATMAKTIEAISRQLDGLASRPAAVCPACNCGSPSPTAAPSALAAAPAAPVVPAVAPARDARLPDAGQ